eukprot:3264851-Rhodomonas_salina.1
MELPLSTPILCPPPRNLSELPHSLGSTTTPPPPRKKKRVGVGGYSVSNGEDGEQSMGLWAAALEHGVIEHTGLRPC